MVLDWFSVKHSEIMEDHIVGTGDCPSYYRQEEHLGREKCVCMGGVNGEKELR